MASPGLKRCLLSKPNSAASSTPRAFYELPEDKPTAAQIVRESRDWLQAVATRRPYTPKDQSRSLIGPGYKHSSARPLSAFKLNAKCFDPLDSTINQYVDRVNPVNHVNTFSAVPETSGIPDVARVRSPRGQGRGRMFKKFTSGDRTLPSPSVPPGKQCNDTGLGTSATANRQPNEAKLELIGTQTKLLTHAQPKLLTPSLSLTSNQRMTIDCALPGTSNEEELCAQRVKPGSNSGDKRGSKNGQTRSRQAPIVNQPHNAPWSASRKLASPCLHSPDIDSGVDIRWPSGSKRSPLAQSDNSSVDDYCSMKQTEFNRRSDRDHPIDLVDLSLRCESGLELTNDVPSTENGLPLLRPATFERTPKLRSGGSHRPRSQPTRTINLIPASGDSGLSSVSELDQLIGRLTEWTHQSHASKPAELQLEVDESEVSNETGRARSGEFGLMDSQAEQHIIALLERIYCALRESGLASKPKWSNRTALLKALFALLDRTSPRLHLALARVILMIRVSGVNLTNVCKLVYKVAKEAQNDAIFLEHPDTLDCLIDTMQLLDNLGPTVGFMVNETSDLSLENLDALLFLTGALKFLAASPVVAESLHRRPAFLIGLFSVHQQIHQRLQTLWSDESSSVVSSDNRSELEERFYLVLAQVSDIFCNLTGNPTLRAKLIPAGGVMDHVIDCLICHTDWTTHSSISTPPSSARYLVQFNWIRLLARLTEYTEVCLRLDSWTGDNRVNSEQNPGGISTEDTHTSTSYASSNEATSRMIVLCTTLLLIIRTHSEDTDLIVRVAYLLGNLTARLDSAREALFPNAEALVGICALCQLHHRSMKIKSKSDMKTCVTSRDDPKVAWSISSPYSDKETDPEPEHPSLAVVNKLVRILANATIGEVVGQLSVAGTECLDLFLDMIANECPWRPTELLVNCLAGLNNITYYIHADAQPNVLAKQYDVAEVLLQTLHGGTAHPDVLLGVIRVFGNLTRQAAVRDWIARHGGQLILNGARTARVTQPRAVWPNTVNEDQIVLYMLIQNLDSARPELVYSTLGVLINLMTDVDQRPAFRQLGGITKLVEVLRDFAGHDWQLAGLACKTLWNYTETPVESIRSLMDAETLNELYNLLSEFTDQDVVNRMHQSFSVQDSNTEQESVALWRAAWSSEFYPVASEFLSRLTYC